MRLLSGRATATAEIWMREEYLNGNCQASAEEAEDDSEIGMFI
jgi:hypothetical protein